MKKGFTLIELLAVIVILAIIAVIAVPIVLNIIDETKNNSTLRSADFYLDAVELSVAQATLKNKNIEDKMYNILENGNICLEDYNSTSKKCVDSSDEGTDIDILEVEVKGEHPKEGTITIKGGNISNVDITLSEKRITKNDNGEIIYFPCTLISGEENTIGSKYECEVSPGTKYNFYVLSYNDENNTSTNDKTKAITANLIMDRNMYYDSKNDTSGPADENNTGLIEWDENYINGLAKVMDYLYNTTKDWINISDIIANYVDEGYGYGTIVTTNGVTKLTKIDGSTITVLTDKEGYINLKARMPYYCELSNYSSDLNNGYLYENLACLEYSCVDGLTHIDGIPGYWTLSNDSEFGYRNLFIRLDGSVTNNYANYAFGVRPVITLKI